MPVRKITRGLLSAAAVLGVAFYWLCVRIRDNAPQPSPEETAWTVEQPAPAPQPDEQSPMDDPESWPPSTVRISEPARTGSEFIADEESSEDQSDPLRRQAVYEWDLLVETLLARETIDLASESGRVQQAFNRMHLDDQLEPLQQALMMFSDPQFLVLYDILFDHQQNPEVVEAIFDDALNRSEELKLHLLIKIREDREHPCYFESARILDVIDDSEER